MPPTSPGPAGAQLLAQALQAHQQGNLAAAEPLYQRVLAAEPQNFDALHFLGVLHAQKGENEEAVRLIRRALRVNPNSPAAYNNHANALRELKRFDEALASYDRALALNPQYANALYNRGNALQELKRPTEALASYEKAVALIPNFFEAHLNRGNALREMNRPSEALAAFDKVIALRPDLADAHYNRASALKDLGRLDEAIWEWDRAIALRPDFVAAVINRSNALQLLKRPADALAGYDRALAIKPDALDAHCGRANALRELRRYDEALTSLDAALAINPKSPDAYCGRAAVLKDLKRYDDALTACDCAIECSPEYAQAYHYRGRVLQDLRRLEETRESYERAVALGLEEAELFYYRGQVLQVAKRSEEALASFDKAIALRANYAEAYDDRGLVLQDMNRLDDAIASYTHAIALKPSLASAFSHRGNLYMEHQQFETAVADFEQTMYLDPDYDYARGNLVHCRMHCCNWKDYGLEVSRIEAGVRADKCVVTPFPFQAISGNPADLLRCSRIFAEDVYPAKAPIAADRRYAHEKIRLGYLCGEFREQATSYLTVGMFEHHDKSRFTLTAFDNGQDDKGPTRKRLEAAFDAFVEIGKLSDAEAARRIAGLEIDILVDLNGYFGLERTGVFAHRPAPLQVNYLGFPATLGAAYFDYILADACVIPEAERGDYVEQVVWLPHSYQPNDAKRTIGEQTPSRAEAGLPEGAFVFATFNNSYKFTPDIFALWMRILAQVPGSVLWVLESNQAVARNLRREAEARGIAGERIVFAPFMKLAEHLARQRLADLFLDSLPYNAHTTASDALWAGLPVITCKGTAFPGRVAASLLAAVGLPELVTASLADYEALAVALAQDPARLGALKAKLAANRLTCPLFDTARFIRQVEDAFVTMWARHQNRLPPAPFAVPERN